MESFFLVATTIFFAAEIMIPFLCVLYTDVSNLVLLPIIERPSVIVM